MFRKQLDVQKETKYSGKDIKKVNALLAIKFGEGAGFGSRANVYVKTESSCGQLISVKSEDEEEYCFGALDAKAFDRALTAAANGDRGKVSDIEAAVLFPSLHRLWKFIGEQPDESCPLNVAPVHVHSNVSHYVLNGAEFMAPGLQGREYPYPEGAMVALYVVGNPLPFAIGQWQGNRKSGVAVKVLTRFGDSLWMQNPMKPEGFTPTSVLSLADNEDAGEAESAKACEAENGDLVVQNETGQTQEEEEEAEKVGEESTKEVMDALLLQSFLQAAKTTLKQDGKDGTLKLGPLPLDVFYSQYVRPARPADSSIDVHKSTYKKVGKFVDFLKDSDFLATDSKGQIVRICRAHPDIRSFELHEVEDIGDSKVTSSKKNGVSSLYVEGIASSHVDFPLFLLIPELNKLFFDAAGKCVSPHYRERPGATPFSPPARDLDDDGAPQGRGSAAQDFSAWEVYVEQAQVAEAVKSFSSRHDLMVSKKLVDVKGLGIQILLQDEGDDAKPVTVDGLARRILEIGVARKQFHKITTVSMVGEEKVSYRQGAPQRVDIRTEKRKNHNVTILQGLDARCYGYDLTKLADFFKRKFSVATFLEEMGSAQFIVVGGFFDRDLEQICTKDFGIPADCVENLAASRKADMKQRKK